MLRRAVTVLLAAVLTVGAAAGAASAARVVRHDPAGDVWRVFASPDVRPAAAPRRHNIDIRRTAFRHGPHNVVVRTRFARLRTGGAYASVDTRLQNGRGTYREVVVQTRPGNRVGTVRVFDRAGRPVACPASERIAYRRNVITVVVPRGCLDTPKLVRASTAVYWTDRKHRTFTDNPHNHHARTHAWTHWISHR